MKLRQVYLILLALLFTVSAVAQSTDSEKKLLRKGRKYLSEADYDKAKETYNQLIKINPENCEYQFEGGLAYFNSEFEKEKSVGYFEQAMKFMATDTIAEIFLYLGKAYHYTHQFDKAIYYYNEFRRYLENTMEGALLGSDVGRLIEMCNNGIGFKAEENKIITIQSLGDKVNTRYAEYAPVVKEDESSVLYTGRKAGTTGGNFYHDSKYFEDIYITLKDKDTLKWAYPTKFDSSGIFISGKVNTKTHDAAIGYNGDETKLYIYRDKDVWQSEIKNGIWQAPVRMNKNVNSGSHEPSVFISADEKMIFIVSTRPGGFGGRDIWVSKKLEDGTWGPVDNMGDFVNTHNDEDAPYLSKDGKTFYFSSRGHNTMGGYDVFRCEMREDGTWSKPINMGMPINSAGDDIYYLVNSDNTVGYYSSSRMGGYGDMDIYRITLDCRNLPNTEVRGLIVAGDRQLPVGAQITVTEKDSGKVVGTYSADKFSGKYFMILQPNKSYILEVIADGFEASRPHREEFTIPKQCESFQLFQQINIRRYQDTIRKQLAQEAHFHNAMFDIATEAIGAYKIEKLPEDGSFLNTYANPDLNYSLGGKVMHNDVIPAKNTEVYLVNENNEIIRTTKTNEDGVFQFLHLKPEEKYTVLINEEDARLSYFGDSQINSSQEITLKGTLEFTNLTEKKTTPAAKIPVRLVDAQKVITNVTVTDDKGNFIFEKKEKNQKTLDELKALITYIYKIDIGDADQLFSSFIKSIDTALTDLNYTEFIDIIYLEKIIRSLPQFENIYFDFDKFFLRPKSIEVLEKITAFMQSNPDVTIVMGGHCDWKGTDAYNVKLSERRANAAYNFLINKGIAANRMQKGWYGEAQPAVANANPDGTDNPDNRQLNRRVEFKVNIPDMAEFTFMF